MNGDCYRGWNKPEPEDAYESIVATRRMAAEHVAGLTRDVAQLRERVAQLEHRLDARHVCPLCHGEGIVVHEGTGPDDPSEDVDCPICEGAGRLNDEELTYYEYYGMSLKAKVRPMSVGQEIPIN